MILVIFNSHFPGFRCIYCDLRTEYLHTKKINFSLQMVFDLSELQTFVQQSNQYNWRPCRYNKHNFYQCFIFYEKFIPVVWLVTVSYSRTEYLHKKNLVSFCLQMFFSTYQSYKLLSNKVPYFSIDNARVIYTKKV